MSIRGESLQRAPTELIRVLYKRLRLVRGVYLLPSGVGLDTRAYRPYGESLYGDKRIEFDITNWGGRVCVHEDALSVKRPLVRSHFRSSKKSNS